MEFSTSSSRFSKEEDEEEEQEHEEEEEDDEASPREIPFMTAAAAATVADTAAASSSSSPSASASASASVLRSSDGAGASGRAGGAGGTDDVEVIEKEHMFDKVVTPSDVGKLNRLVIPKQHAEKYFPLDAAANEKGLLLSFEDRSGKPWRFRYSYWNSSQSYVMTKGWSRFVKEKRLDAGDTVSFGRGVGEHARGRLFIDWRRRPDPPAPYYHRLPLPSSVPFAPWAHAHYPAAGIGGTTSRTVLHLPPSPSSLLYDYSHYSHNRRHDDGYGPSITRNKLLFYRPHQHQHQHQQATVVLESVPVRMIPTAPPVHAEPPLPPSVASSAGSKRLRLFGVNLDCAGASEEENGGRMSVPPQLPSPPSSSSSCTGKARCSLNLDL